MKALDQHSVESVDSNVVDTRTPQNEISLQKSHGEDDEDDEDDGLRIMAILSDAMDECADDTNWCQWFCSLPGNEGFVLVDDEFLQDDFNLIGLGKFVPNMNKVLDFILDQENTDSESESIDSHVSAEEEDDEDLKMSAIVLYGLVHARFLMTNKGMLLALEKYSQNVYGSCPNVNCNGQNTMPIGISDTLNIDCAKVYCPMCCDIYHPTHGTDCWVAGNDIDGSFYGRSFAPAFFLRAIPSILPTLPVPKSFIPKIYGFRLHPGERNRVVMRHFRRKALMEVQQELDLKEREATT
eukprot:GHVH01004812.1.p1 GENE.GHVH01004812.1~~GHVH01004812.1.p1  ORF type:complete len:296 (+),score=58.23 GHVH01004812.1:110-997(+)